MTAREMARTIVADRLAAASLSVLLVMGLVALLGPWVAPHDPLVRLSGPDGSLAYLEPPSTRHLLGTTNAGRDIFSQLLVGTRVAFFVGIVAALTSTAMGLTLGLIAGYYKGVVDNLIMRAVEIAYALPLEPLAIVLLAFVGQSLWGIILAIVLLLWRSSARVIRTQVLSVSERAFVKSARAMGATNRRIIFGHIAPNILPIGLVYLPIVFGQAVIAEAAISFLGFGDPTVISWGQMLRNVFEVGAMRQAWVWVLAPGAAITLAVSSVFFATRPFEEILNPRLRSAQRSGR